MGSKIPRSARNPLGFTEFVVARADSLHRTALLLTGNQAGAEALVHLALVKAWHTRRCITSDQETSVRRIMVNEFATGWHHRWHEEQLSVADLPLAHTPGGPDDVTLNQVLMAALGQLPPRQRAVVVLRFFHDYTEARTADALGVSIRTVTSDTAKALSSLGVADPLQDTASGYAGTARNHAGAHR